jgi:hypothetical protein
MDAAELAALDVPRESVVATLPPAPLAPVRARRLRGGSDGVVTQITLYEGGSIRAFGVVHLIVVATPPPPPSSPMPHLTPWQFLFSSSAVSQQYDQRA